jgi:hypothetical protein
MATPPSRLRMSAIVPTLPPYAIMAVLSPLLLNCALEYATGRIQGNQEGLRTNGTYQLLVYADYVNLLGESTNTVQKTHINFTTC